MNAFLFRAGSTVLLRAVAGKAALSTGIAVVSGFAFSKSDAYLIVLGIAIYFLLTFIERFYRSGREVLSLYPTHSLLSWQTYAGQNEPVTDC